MSLPSPRVYGQSSIDGRCSGLYEGCQEWKYVWNLCNSDISTCSRTNQVTSRIWGVSRRVWEEERWYTSSASTLWLWHRTPRRCATSLWSNLQPLLEWAYRIARLPWWKFRKELHSTFQVTCWSSYPICQEERRLPSDVRGLSWTKQGHCRLFQDFSINSVEQRSTPRLIFVKRTT